MDDDRIRIEELMQKHRGAAIKRGGTFYFAQSLAIALIREAQLEGLGIGLIDAFFLTDTTTQPSMEDSVDFITYGTPDRSEPYDYAYKLVGDPSRRDMFFEIILCPLE